MTEEDIKNAEECLAWMATNAVTLQGLINGKLVAVPVEPTEAMQRAYYEASAKAAREDFKINAGPWDELPRAQRARLAEFGRAMIGARP